MIDLYARLGRGNPATWPGPDRLDSKCIQLMFEVTVALLPSSSVLTFYKHVVSSWTVGLAEINFYPADRPYSNPLDEKTCNR